MAQQITLWLKQTGNNVEVLCSDPPGERLTGDPQALRDQATHVVQIPAAHGNYVIAPEQAVNAEQADAGDGGISPNE